MEKTESERWKELIKEDNNAFFVTRKKKKEELIENTESSSDSYSKRWKDLVDSFSAKNEIFVKKEDKKLNEELINKENDRLRKLGTKDSNRFFRELTNEEYYSTTASPGYTTGGNKQFAKTVNTITDDALGNVAINYKPIRQPLRKEEALLIALRRVLTSGDVNNIGFYDEVNQNLNSMGFPAVTVLAIKDGLNNLNEPSHNKVD